MKEVKALKLCYIQRLISDFIYLHLSKMMQKENPFPISYTFIVKISEKISVQKIDIDYNDFLYREMLLNIISWNKLK
jgi:hypothetical protein